VKDTLVNARTTTMARLAATSTARAIVILATTVVRVTNLHIKKRVFVSPASLVLDVKSLSVQPVLRVARTAAPVRWFKMFTVNVTALKTMAERVASSCSMVSVEAKKTVVVSVASMLEVLIVDAFVRAAIPPNRTVLKSVLLLATRSRVD